MSEATTHTRPPRICPECGVKRPINATACPVCGTPTSRAAAETKPGEAGEAGAGTWQPQQQRQGPPSDSSQSSESLSEPSEPESRPADGSDGAGQRQRQRQRQRQDVSDATETPARPRSDAGKGRRPGPAEGSKRPPSLLDRLRKLDGLSAVRRLVSLAALVVILLALGYAILPFKSGRSTCSPAIVQVLDRQRLTRPSTPGGPPGPPITAVPAVPAGTPPVATPRGVLKPCTEGAKRRLYYAGPVVVLALIGSAGARRALT